MASKLPEGYYAILKVNYYGGCLECKDKDGDPKNFRLGDFTGPAKDEVANLFDAMRNCRMLFQADPLIITFLSRYQLVDGRIRYQAKLIERSRKMVKYFDGGRRLFKIHDLEYTGEVICEYLTVDYRGCEIWKDATFEVWQFTDIQSLRILQQHALSSERTYGGFHRGTANSMIKAEAQNLLARYNSVSINGRGEVKFKT